MFETIDSHIRKAEAILDANWTGSYTVPAPGLYPHQWNWDSGFAAIGYSHYAPDRAVSELKRLFEAQWKNGMLPQIVFNPERLGGYFPEPDFWQTGRSGNAPEDALTSGITMPPIHAYAVLSLYENSLDPASLTDFLAWIYPRLLELHRYLYRERDPEGTGLVYIRHPWESGMDNSPMWDMLLGGIDLSKAGVPEYSRKDLSKGVDPGQRPTGDAYDRFVHLVDLARRLDYDEARIRAECPFLVHGPLFNSVLAVSNEALATLAEILGEPADEPESWYQKTTRAISENLFNEERGIFNFYDLNAGRLIEVDTAAGFMPLFAGAATPEQTHALYKYLNSASFCALHQGNCFSIPNYDVQKEGFERENYWRGPVWININWMLMKGLRRYGFTQKADSVAKDIMELPVRFGFYEYFDSFDGRGYGASDFSWTAALFIDTARRTYAPAPEGPLSARIKRVLWGEIVLNGRPGEAGGAVEDAARAPGPGNERLAGEMLSTIKDIKSSFYTEKGTVDYDSMRTSPEYAEYRRLASRLKGFDPALIKDEREKLAFWINLYNTIVVDGIIELGIRSSVKEVIGFFSRIKYRIGRFRFSPDDIEHGILRANARPYMHAFRQFGPFDGRRAFIVERVDPRIHFALVCGSRSCAPIKFYTPEGIDEELETATVNFINSSEVIVIPEEKKVALSQIFRWYERDLGGRDGVLDFLERYVADDRKKEFLRRNRDKVRLEYLYYDWNLNA